MKILQPITKNTCSRSSDTSSNSISLSPSSYNSWNLLAQGTIVKSGPLPICNNKKFKQSGQSHDLWWYSYDKIKQYTFWVGLGALYSPMQSELLQLLFCGQREGQTEILRESNSWAL